MGEKNAKWKYYAISGVFILVFLLVWYLISDVFHVSRHNMLPGPGKIVQSLFVKLTSKVPDGNTLLGHIKASLIVVVIGYLIGVAAGLSTGIFMVWYKPVDYMAKPIFDFLRIISGITWIPVVTVWLGAGLKARAAIIFVNVFMGTVVNVHSGIKQINEVHIWVARIFGAGKSEILWKVAIPFALSYIFTGLKVPPSMAWLRTVAAELLASQSELGCMIQVARNLGRPDLVIVGVLAIGLIGALLAVALELLEKILAKGKKR